MENNFDTKDKIRLNHIQTTLKSLNMRPDQESDLRDLIFSNESYLGKRLFVLLCHYLGYNDNNYAYTYNKISGMMGIGSEQVAKNYNDAVRRLRMKIIGSESINGMSKEDIGVFNGLKPRVKNALASSGIHSMTQLMESMKEHHCTTTAELNAIMDFRGLGDSLCEYLDAVIIEYYGHEPHFVYSEEDNQLYYNNRLRRIADAIGIDASAVLYVIDEMAYIYRLTDTEYFILQLYLGLDERGLIYSFPKIASYRNIALHYVVDVYNKCIMMLKEKLDSLRVDLFCGESDIFVGFIRGEISIPLYQWLLHTYGWERTTFETIRFSYNEKKHLYDYIIGTEIVPDELKDELKAVIELTMKRDAEGCRA